MEDDDGDTALFLEEAEAEAAAQLGDTAAEIYAKHRRSTSAESRQVRFRCRAALNAASHAYATLLTLCGGCIVRFARAWRLCLPSSPSRACLQRR